MRTSHPIRMLLIEDNSADITLLRHSLDRTGTEYLLDVIHDGESALQFIRQHWDTVLEPPICMVILDLHLPKCDGVTLLSLLRKSPAFHDVKMAVVTTSASPLVERELDLLQVDLYRRKPTELTEFFQLAAELIEVCHGEQTGVAA